MLSLLFYKNLHLLGVFMLFIALGGVILHQINATARENIWRKPVAITHALGMVLVLVGGFGMLARLRITWTWPGPVTAKIVLRHLFGALIAVIRRAPALAKPLWWVTIVLGALAAYLALNHPF